MEIKNSKILFSVLNWGLGHATRSTALIKKLLKQNNTVVIASDGYALAYLKSKFPQLTFFELPPYKVNYGKNRTLALLKNGIATQKSVAAERKWLDRHLKSNAYDLIISDNRYGICSQHIPSYIITHQLNIKVPFGAVVVNWQNHKWLSKFAEIWVPDVNHELSGELSYPIPPRLQGKVKQIGWLSRFDKKETNEQSNEKLIVAIVSGPEPERTIFANKLISKLAVHPIPSILYLGKPDGDLLIKQGNCLIKSHATDEVMSSDIERATTVISRSGYSSIMDYKVMRKSAILIPTPGQTEQEYLAKHLASSFTVLSAEEFEAGGWDLN